MFGGFFGKLLSGLFKSLVGGASSAPAPVPDGLQENASMQPSSVPLPDSPYAASDFFDGLKRGLGDRAQEFVGDAVFGRASARMQGRMAKEYSDSAYPGTTPWEQLGSNSGSGFTSGAMQGAQMRQQAEMQDKQNAVTLGVAQLQAMQAVGTKLIEQGGSASLPIVLKLLSASGSLPASLDTKGLARLKADAEIGNLDAAAFNSRASGQYTSGLNPETVNLANLASARQNLSAEQKNLMQVALEPYQAAFDQWFKVYGGNGDRLIDSLRGWAGQASLALSGDARLTSPTLNHKALTDDLVSRIAKISGEGEAYQLRVLINREVGK